MASILASRQVESGHNLTRLCPASNLPTALVSRFWIFSGKSKTSTFGRARPGPDRGCRPRTPLHIRPSPNRAGAADGRYMLMPPYAARLFSLAATSVISMAAFPLGFGKSYQISRSLSILGRVLQDPASPVLGTPYRGPSQVHGIPEPLRVREFLSVRGSGPVPGPDPFMVY